MWWEVTEKYTHKMLDLSHILGFLCILIDIFDTNFAWAFRMPGYPNWRGEFTQ